MAVEHFPQNLRLLCSYGQSVTDICRRVKINRQQFNRYLSGKSRPSLHTVRRICDFFGIDDHEMFLDYGEFHDLIRLRPPRLDRTQNPLHAFYDRLCQSPDQRIKDADKYVGYYFYYFQPDRQSRVIYRNLFRIYKEGDLLLTKQLERYPNSEFNLPNVMKHEGIAYSMSDRLVITEREEQSGASLWHAIFYASDYNRVTFLSGLSLGITPDSAHEIICTRALLEYLGDEIDLKATLKSCGAHEFESPEIGDYIRHCVSNNLQSNDIAFSPVF